MVQLKCEVAHQNPATKCLQLNMLTRPEVTQAKTKQNQTLYTVRLDSCTLGKNIKHNQATNEKQVFEKRKTHAEISCLPFP